VSKAQRKDRALRRTVESLTPAQAEAVIAASHYSGSGYLVNRKLGLPADMVERFSVSFMRLTDPFGIAVREALIADLCGPMGRGR
jgi:hypothetical protein